MKILVTGGNGTMGRALREFLPEAVYLSRQECDVTQWRSVAAALDLHKPDVVIHAAAITDHQHPNASEMIDTNIIGTSWVAIGCRALGAKMVYLSTHYVYPGETGNYKETADPRPIGAYAWSKWAGEGWAKMPDYWLVVRGSWYGADKLEKFKRGALTDAWCNRESVPSAASKIALLVRRDATGIYNIGGARRTFFDIAGANAVPMTRAQLRQRIPYDFPADSSVNTDKYEALVGRT